MLCTFARASGNRELGRVGGEEETLNIQLRLPRHTPDYNSTTDNMCVCVCVCVCVCE